LATLVATESSPEGKIMREAGVFICFHFMEEGSPPNTCAFPATAMNDNTRCREIILKKAIMIILNPLCD
jgi:hypothetical protein